MKKLYTDSLFKKQNTQRSQVNFKRKLKERSKRKARRIAQAFTNPDKQVSRTLIGQANFNQLKQTVLSPPADFSFLDNTERTLEFIQSLEACMKRRVRILVDLTKVTNLTNDTIALLLAVIHNPHIDRRCTEVRGNYPQDAKLRKILEESGIFKDAKGGTKNFILTRREKNADGEIAQEVIDKATQALFGSKGRCPGIYRALMEAMANTCFHAKPDRKAYETWWLSVCHNRETETISFAFIDMGVGIFKSRKMRIFTEKVRSFIGIVDNKDLLRDILEGKVMSSTKLPYRGKGLPAIYQGVKRNYYSHLRIISNDVKANPENNKYESLKSEFNGTFLYWEFNTENSWINS